MPSPKLSEAQMRVLRAMSEGHALFRPTIGRQWQLRRGPVVATATVRILMKNELIELVCQSVSAHTYGLTDAARALLGEESKP